LAKETRDKKKAAILEAKRKGTTIAPTAQEKKQKEKEKIKVKRIRTQNKAWKKVLHTKL